MKNIFKKNQLVITTLAIMIAVAGYLNFAGSKLTEEENIETSGSGVENINVADISDEDIYAENNLALTDGGTEEVLSSNTNEEGTVETNGEVLEDIESLDLDLSSVTAGTETEGSPGEAVLTNASANVGFVAEARLAREQVRAKNKEMLLEVINNTNITDAQKQEAIDNMIAMTDLAEREAAAEMLLEAKGFTDVVVNINGDTADVVVNMTELTDAKRAQIEDIMKRKTGVSAENIVITPMEGAE